MADFQVIFNQPVLHIDHGVVKAVNSSVLGLQPNRYGRKQLCFL